jgi:hypothetical protein
LVVADLKTVLTETLREALVSAHPFNGGNYPDWFREWIEEAAPKAADALLGLSGVAVTQLPAEVRTDQELTDLPDGSVIWYWVTYDGVEIHQQLMKHGDWWRNANDPDDAHEYFPTTERLSITLLRRGWAAAGVFSEGATND